jgi:hypothetical protein
MQPKELDEAVKRPGGPFFPDFSRLFPAVSMASAVDDCFIANYRRSA